MKFLKPLFIITIWILFIFFFERPQKIWKMVLPPLGRLLDPVNGFWANSERTDSPPQIFKTEGFSYQKPVEIIYDERRVPHIFAQNDADLFRAQGYVTAAERLWQMDFQTAAAGGELSSFLYHIAGAKVLELDRYKRRIGMRWAAEKTLEYFSQDSLARRIIESYTQGVNDYISTLNYRRLPLEYKILDYRPRSWTPLKCALLLKYMAEMLTNDEKDLEITEAISIMGEEYKELLFPLFPDTLLDPIIPPNTPSNACSSLAQSQNKFFDENIKVNIKDKINVLPPSQKPEMGSNNWAVSGSRTNTGRPILCGDPHLGLNLPSLWYEIQLNAPGVNVYGVSLPGAPGVVIGFNENIAWSMTNAMRDVRDWYAVRFSNPEGTAMDFDGSSKPIEIRLDSIICRGAQSFIDTIRLTHWGPIVYDRSFQHPAIDTLNLALRWVAHYPSAELLAIYYINRSEGLSSFQQALSYFSCPGQNFAFADKKGNIALFQQGLFPAYTHNDGRRIRIGANKDEEWPGWIARECNPTVVNPPSGFVSSANQHPTGPDNRWQNAAQYSGNFEHFRNRRINEILREDRTFSVEDLKKLQLDNKNLMAELMLPFALKELRDVPEGKAMECRRILERWNYFNEPDSIAPSIFYLWFIEFERLLWDELSRSPGCFPQEFYTILFMIRFSQHRWYDIDSTKGLEETRQDIINISFRNTVDKIQKWEAENVGTMAKWYLVKNTQVRHLLPVFESFGLQNIFIGGGKHIVNACGSSWGPSWRMIVSLEDTIKAYGIYPGGPSGNPGSHWYVSSVSHWASGEYYPLQFMKNLNDISFKPYFNVRLH